MKITVEFGDWEELEAFRTSGKKTRAKGAKDDDGETGGANVGNIPGNGQAPAPQMPSGAQLQAAAGGAGAGLSAAPGAFPGGGMAPVMGGDPAVAALVQRISVRVDGAIASGQPAEGVTQWLRNACVQIDSAAGQADLNTLKTVYLFKLPVASLDAMAKTMGA